MPKQLMPDEIYARAEAHGNDWCITPEFGVKYVRADYVERLMKNSVDVLALHDKLSVAYDELGVMYDKIKAENDALRDGEQSERTEWKGQPEL